MEKKLGWGIIATGRIAGKFARGLAHSETGRLVAVASRTKEKADQFGAEHGAPRCYGSYEELLADSEVDAVYISTPHPMHAEWTIKAAQAGKHILCEKPLGINRKEVEAMIEAARSNDVFLMEAFMYRCHPQTLKLVELIRDGAVGTVRLIQTTFSFHSAVLPEHRLLSNVLGGGGILDVGCYAVSMSRLIAGAALGKDFCDPIEVHGFGCLHPVTGVDSYSVGEMLFPEGIIAQIASGVQLAQENVVRIYGDQGFIIVPWPWGPSLEGGTTQIFINRSGVPVEEYLVDTNNWLYTIEADTVAENIEKREAPAMSWADSLGNITALDAWREAIGLVYEIEKQAGSGRSF